MAERMPVKHRRLRKRSIVTTRPRKSWPENEHGEKVEESWPENEHGEKVEESRPREYLENAQGCESDPSPQHG